jgi:hypothetical protein
LAEYRKEIAAAVSAAIVLAALVGAVAIYSFPHSSTGSPPTKGNSLAAGQFAASLEGSVSAFQTQLLLSARGTGVSGEEVASLTRNLAAMQDNYTNKDLLYNLTFRGLSTTFRALDSELVFVSSKSQVNTSSIELNASNGAVVCPRDFSGFGSAAWNGSSNTCTLTQTNPDVGPTLCMGVSSGGCVIMAALRYRIDLGVTLDLNLSTSDVCVYSVLDNYGVVDVLKNENNSIAGLCNYGVIDNYGTIILNGPSSNLPYNGGGVINNFAGAVIYNDETFANGGVINNFGTFINAGRLEDCIGGSPMAYGTINYGAYDNLGTVSKCSAPPTPYDYYTVFITTSPSSITPAMYVNGTLQEAPYAFTSGPGDVTNITAAATFGTSPSYHFVSWSNGENRAQQFVTAGNATLTATYSK